MPLYPCKSRSVRSSKALGLSVLEVTLVSPDISIPYWENGTVVIGTNPSPDLSVYTPSVRPVAACVLDTIFPAGAEARIPLIAVTGTNGKTTTVRLISHLLRTAHRIVGFKTTDGICIDTRVVIQGDIPSAFAAQLLLTNPTVEVVVLEAARGGILDMGLGFEEADVSVVLNVSGDHLGLKGIHTLEQLAEVKGVVASAARKDGHVALNADDPLVCGMRTRIQAQSVLFTAGPRDHHPMRNEHAGIWVCVENHVYVIHHGQIRIAIATVAEVPLTVGGTAAHFQNYNVLAAIAVGYVQGLPPDVIRNGLLTFFPSPEMNPGRVNLLRVGAYTVVVDYAHNIQSMRALVEFAQANFATRRIAMVGAPGDRRDEDIHECGRIAASFDYVVLRERDHPSPRPPGDVAALLSAGLQAGGMEPSRWEVVLSEREAIHRILKLARPGDLVLLLAYDVDAAIAQVLSHSACHLASS